MGNVKDSNMCSVKDSNYEFFNECISLWNAEGLLRVESINVIQELVSVSSVVVVCEAWGEGEGRRLDGVKGWWPENVLTGGRKTMAVYWSRCNKIRVVHYEYLEVGEFVVLSGEGRRWIGFYLRPAVRSKIKKGGEKREEWSQKMERWITRDTVLVGDGNGVSKTWDFRGKETRETEQGQWLYKKFVAWGKAPVRLDKGTTCFDSCIDICGVPICQRRLWEGRVGS